MQDPIIDQLNQDVALANALRNFLASPPIITFIKACVADAVRDELDRRAPRDLSSEISHAIDNYMEDDNKLKRRISGLIDYGEIAAALDLYDVAREVDSRDLAREIDLEDLASHITIDEDAIESKIDYHSLANALIRQARAS